MPGRPPCRLHVYLAREAPIAAVLRRGPTDWARLSLWRTDTDTFEHGQWIKGRVYERRSDLSPDGSLFVAFVRQSGGKVREGQKADTWVAVSRPPYFTALALWFVGGTYHTGGFFPNRWSLWSGYGEAGPDQGQLPIWLESIPPHAIAYIDGTPEWTDRTVHFNRLLRDGWVLEESATHRSRWKRKRSGGSDSLLMDQALAKSGRYDVEYSVELDNHVEELGLADWADWTSKGVSSSREMAFSGDEMTSASFTGSSTSMTRYRNQSRRRNGRHLGRDGPSSDFPPGSCGYGFALGERDVGGALGFRR
jgi:hypothetical protein